MLWYKQHILFCSLLYLYAPEFSHFTRSVCANACRNRNSLQYRTVQYIYDIVPLVEKCVYEEGVKLNGSH